MCVEILGLVTQVMGQRARWEGAIVERVDISHWH
jgi:hypothetical protein